MQLKNNEGEKLYLLIITNSNEFNRPHIKIDTWGNIVNGFENLIQEVDNNSWLIKQIKVERLPEYHRMEATLLCNHKGWGADFIKVIYVESVYSL